MPRTLAVFTFLLLPSALLSHTDRAVLDKAMAAISATPLKSIQYSGSGAVFTVGQNKNPSLPWPRVDIKSYTITLDYPNRAVRTESQQGANRVQTFLREGLAWNVGANNNPVAAPPAVVAVRQTQMWLTPYGFLTAAAANNATVRRRKIDGKDMHVVSFIEGKRRWSGTINTDGLVEGVTTQMDNPVLGDMPVEVMFSGYKDFGGVKFPAKIVQKDGGHPSFDLDVAEVKPNVELAVDVPAAVRSATAPAVKVESQKIADGVWYLTGGSHHSVAVEFKDHVVVIEGPQTEERTAAVIEEVRKTVPGKPARYLVSTHHHFDHSGGVRAAAAEKLNIVAQQTNKDFYEKAVGARRTLNPGKYPGKVKPKVIAFTDKHVLTDGVRSLELYHIMGNPHHDGMLMAYFPKEKFLVEADVFTPPAANAAPPATPNPAAVNLYENIQRLKLDVAQIVPIHGRMVPLAELERVIGRGKPQ